MSKAPTRRQFKEAMTVQPGLPSKVQHRFAIGIDPGEGCGVAVFDRVEKKLVEVLTLDFWRAYWHAVNGYAVYDCRIYVELTKDLRVYRRHYKSVAGRQDPLLKIAMNAGGVVREAELLIRGLRLAGFDVVECPATGKNWTDDLFKRITRYEARASQHARDAASLCWGR